MNPFERGPIPGLTNTTCLSVLMFLTARDLAVSAPVSSRWRGLLSEAVPLACITVYNRHAPTPRPLESWTRVLRFVEAVHRAQGLCRIATFAVTAGTYHNVVVTASGQAAVFGDSERGQVRTAPCCCAVVAPLLLSHRPTHCHVCRRCREKLILTLPCFFLRSMQAGVGSSKRAAVPVVLETLADHRVVQAAAGDEHSLFVTEAGQLWGCGRGDVGQLTVGLGSDDVTIDEPVLMTALRGKSVIQAAAGAEHTVVLTSTGEVLAFGAGDCGQLGRMIEEYKSADDAFTPMLAHGLTRARVVQVLFVSIPPASSSP